jgi:hypothetical protein
MKTSAEPKKVEVKAKPVVNQAVKPFSKADQLHSKPSKKGATLTAKPTAIVEPPKPPIQMAPVDEDMEAFQRIQELKKQPTANELLVQRLASDQEPEAPITLESLKKAFDLLRQDFLALSMKVEETQAMVARKRAPAANGNGKVQIKDSKTNIVYKSKNNVYQTLLRNNELTDLISQGVFGADPKKNSFGWYSLNRAFPGRFVEVKPEQQA